MRTARRLAGRGLAGRGLQFSQFSTASAGCVVIMWGLLFCAMAARTPFKRRDLPVTQLEKRGVACATLRRRRKTRRGIRSRLARCRGDRAARCLLDDLHGAAADRSAVCRDVIAGLGDARSAGERDVQHRLADADPGVLAAVPAARMSAAVGRALAIEDVGTVTIVGKRRRPRPYSRRCWRNRGAGLPERRCRPRR